jgi:hypothetical protein
MTFRTYRLRTLSLQPSRGVLVGSLVDRSSLDGEPLVAIENPWDPGEIILRSGHANHVQAYLGRGMEWQRLYVLESPEELARFDMQHGMAKLGLREYQQELRDTCREARGWAFQGITNPRLIQVIRAPDYVRALTRMPTSELLPDSVVARIHDRITRYQN